MFSSRTTWDRQPNRFYSAVEAAKKRGDQLIDLTASNPTMCGFEYPHREVLRAIAADPVMIYDPDPQGLYSARQAVSLYYRERGREVKAEDIFLTSGTSEAYSMILTLLCDPGERILVPSPTYPLLDYLAQISGVDLVPYRLLYDGQWHIDMESIERGCQQSAKGIVIVNPHNPTGMFLKKEERKRLGTIALAYGIPLIVDEVFLDYTFREDNERFGSTATDNSGLVFTLNGVSKSLGLPQMKLGWIVVGGPTPIADEAKSRLEVIADTYLSVHSAVQYALPQLFEAGKTVQSGIQARTRTNLNALLSAVSCSQVSVLKPEGGWNVPIRVPGTKSDDEWAESLIVKSGVIVHPGHFFDFDREATLVISLLPTTETFLMGVSKLLSHIRDEC